MIEWVCLPFAELGVDALYAAMRLRQTVFSVEQACAYLDADGADPACRHLFGWAGGAQLWAYLRIVPPGLKYEEASIGRVVTAPQARGTGLGHALMAEGVSRCSRIHPAHGIRISAQAHLQGFYRRHGFAAVGSEYLEDGIPHIEMLRPADAAG